MKSLNQPLSLVAKFAFALVSVTILVYWLMVLQDILVPLFISIILSMSVFPVANWLENRGLGRVWAVTLTLILFSGIADRKSTRLNSSHVSQSRMPSSA